MTKLSVRFPLEMTGKNPGFDLLSNEDLRELVKFNMKNTLLSCPDERVFDEDDFGACLRRMLFEFPTGPLLASVESKIRSQLSSFVPYIVVEDVAVTNPEDMVMYIRILYYINEIEARDELQLKVTA